MKDSKPTSSNKTKGVTFDCVTKKENSRFETVEVKAKYDESRSKDWEELEFTYLRVERAVLKIQRHYRENRAKYKQTVPIKKTNSINGVKEDDEDGSCIEEKAPRGLGEDFWARCIVAFFETLSMAAFGLITKIVLCFTKCGKKGDDVPVADVQNASTTNASSAPTP